MEMEMEMEVEREVFAVEEAMMKLNTEETMRSKPHDRPESPKVRPGAIKCIGGYGPPPVMISDEEHDEILKRQDERIAAVGLNLLNQNVASEGKKYELVMAHDTARFRTKEGYRFHGNFVAKRSDDPNAESHLFFVVCKLVPGDYEAIEWIDLGPVDADPARYSCEECKRLDLECPTFHPLQFKVGDHSCILCDTNDLVYPIFHPPGRTFNHLFIKATPTRGRIHN